MRKVEVAIVNLPLKCWRPCGSMEISEKAYSAPSVKIRFQPRKLQGYIHNHKHQERKKKIKVQLYSTWMSYKIDGPLAFCISFPEN